MHARRVDATALREDGRSRAVVAGPLGPLTLLGGADGLRALFFDGAAPEPPTQADRTEALSDAARQLGEYFVGARRAFELALDLRGSPLQLRVWGELQRISYGVTVTYSQLAASVGRPDAVRTVASAVAATPVPIVVPCHRVIGADGALRGYIGGLERKAALLDLERRTAPDPAGEGQPEPRRLELT